MLLHVILVNAMGGLLEALRTVSLSPEFTARLFAAIRRQAGAPWDRAAYDRQLQDLYRRYPQTADLVATCSIRCEGGA